MRLTLDIVQLRWCKTFTFSRGGWCSRWLTHTLTQKVVSPLDCFVFGGEAAFVGFFQQLLHDMGELVRHLHRYVGDDFLPFLTHRAQHVALCLFWGLETVGERKRRRDWYWFLGVGSTSCPGWATFFFW